MADPVLLVKGEGVGAGADSMRLQRFPVVGVGAPGEAMTPGMIPGVQLPAGCYGMPSSAEIPESAKHAPVLRQSQVTANLGMEPGAESRFQKYLTGLSGVDNQAQLQLRLYEFFRDNAYPVALRSILLERVRSLYDHQGKLRGTARVRSLRQRGATPDEVPMAGDDAMSKAEQEADDELFKHMGEDTAWEALIKHVNGPFIGPRGGKWADAKHTIAWSDDIATRPPEKGSRVTVHSKGKAPPQGVKWGKNHPGAGYAATIKYKGADYHVAFGHDGKKFTGTLTLPTGHKHAITSPNHAANVVMLHSRGLDTSMTATDVKKLKLGYSAAKLFKFGEKPAERAAKKGPAKPRPVVSAKERAKHEATAARILDGAVPLPTVQVDPPAAPAPAPPPPPAAPVREPTRNKLGVVGKAAPLYMASSHGAPEKQPAKYVLMEAEDIIASHQPHKGFLAHPAYPEGVQERRYDRDTAEQMKVHGVAGQLNPEIVFTPSVDALNGPPVVNQDGHALGGNGRSMALQLHYAANDAKADETRAYLKEHAATYGFHPDDVAAFKNPVVVRQVEAPQDKKALATLVRRYNESSSQGMDKQAAAVGEARRMDERSMGLLGDSMPDDATLNDYLGTRASLPFVDSLRDSGILNQRNASALLNPDGTLNDDGRQMVGRVLTAALIPEANLLEDIGGNTRATLARSAPYVLASAADTDKDWDLRPAIQAAARDLVRARAGGMTTADQYLAQGGLFGDKKEVEGVPMGKDMLRMLLAVGDKPVVFSKVMRQYLSHARQNPRGQVSMFAEEKMPPAETFKQLVDKVVGMSKSLTADDRVTSEDITEWLALASGAMRKSMEPTLTISLQKSVVTADGIAALQDLLGRLQGMREVYQDLHWNSAGPAFYADHQLFERLYSAVVEEVDALAEKIVGLTGAQLSPVLTAARLGGHVSSMVGASAAGPENRALGMLELERAFCEKVIPEVLGTLRVSAELSEGLQNFLQGLADTHEGHVYLLDRRLADPMLTKSEALRKDMGMGEGSRGGHIVGHTSAGKPIYQGANAAPAKQPRHILAVTSSGKKVYNRHTSLETHHALTSEYSAMDHVEAMTAHRKAASNEQPGTHAHAYHTAMAESHDDMKDALSEHTPGGKSWRDDLKHNAAHQANVAAWHGRKMVEGKTEFKKSQVPELDEFPEASERVKAIQEKKASMRKGWDVNPRASGSAVASDVARKELLDRAGDGIGPDGLAGMSARHDPDVIKALVKDLTERGILVQRDGQLHRGLVGPKGLEKGPHAPPKAVFKPKPVESSTPPQMAPADPSQAPAVARNIARNNREAGITAPERPAQLRNETPTAPHQEK